MVQTDLPPDEVPLLQVEHLRTWFPVRTGLLQRFFFTHGDKAVEAVIIARNTIQVGAGQFLTGKVTVTQSGSKLGNGFGIHIQTR